MYLPRIAKTAHITPSEHAERVYQFSRFISAKSVPDKTKTKENILVRLFKDTFGKYAIRTS
jgi:hypothetical protein